MNQRKSPTNLNSFSTDAPDLLLKKIGELELTLRSAKQNATKNQKAIDFYSGILAAMKFAWGYMMELEWIHKKLKIIQAENDFLKDYAGSLKERLLKYEVIEQLKLSGDFDTVVKAVDEYINNNTPDLT
ncbi:hypothetical protein IDJ77_11330 [Mucilaginibacter sp. ZT4R22]|uniref:Uncharacterized protein n=1 Tax=Mucilaginibacter pankratovii TaxID=2772110 RepID=A0ABR7WQC1_9SPHI|nr:hypothetical protein [Mucilaginibacter pankratovii]MBD1364401.1 hypothetical protein [Mucilaginibacter pankratovii]